jgi:hypothetical protein
MVKKIKVKVDINEFIKTGDIIVYNEWLKMWGHEFITYRHKMLSDEFVKNNPEKFEVLK